MHSCGAAIDINTAHADYWQWYSFRGYINRDAGRDRRDLRAEWVYLTRQAGALHLGYCAQLLAN
jgi:hypothetical protein